MGSFSVVRPDYDFELYRATGQSRSITANDKPVDDERLPVTSAIKLGESSDRFESAVGLESALNNVLPREAVGEPYQSEGEG